jgi:hypothetical protein
MEPTGRLEIRDILARIDLAVLLDEIATPANHGTRGRKWHCPIAGHDDQHPSVTMYTDSRGHQRWRCWSGDDRHRGDALDLVIAVRHCSRREAIDWLANRIGHGPEPAPPRRPDHASVQTNATVPLDPAVVTYTTRCAQLLWTTQGAPVRRWLRDRGLGDDVLRVNQVGADPGRQILPRRRGLPAGNGLAATFPALDPAGTVRYVQTRYLEPRPGQPKYDNPASRYGSNPRLAWLRPPVPRHPDRLVICEGIPDALTAAQAGYHAVALLGTHAADPHVATRIAEHATRRKLALTAVVDADHAGRAAGERLAELLAANDLELRIAEPPEGLDLNAWAQRDPSWTTAVEAAGATPARPKALVRHELVTALRLRAAYTTRPTPTDQFARAMVDDNERAITRLEAELDQLVSRPGSVTQQRSPAMDL